MPDTILRLALPSPLRRLFDYLAPQGVPHAALQPGVRLRVPFGRREVVGVHAVYKFTDTDRYGLDTRSRVLVTVKNGAFVLYQ